MENHEINNKPSLYFMEDNNYKELA